MLILAKLLCTWNILLSITIPIAIAVAVALTVAKVRTPLFSLLVSEMSILVNSLSAKSVLAGEKTRSYVLNFYVGIVHNILRETKIWRTKIYLPTQRTNRQILYDIN